MSTSDFNERGDMSRITTYQAGALQASAHRNVQKYCDEILRPYGLTKNQWLVTGLVLDAGTKGIRITELAKLVDTTLPYLTTTINLLESKGVLLRKSSGKDERVKFVTVHPSFVPKCKEIEKNLRTYLRKSIYANISPEEFRTYVKVLHELSLIQ